MPIRADYSHLKETFDMRTFIRAALIRAARTAAQTAIGAIGATALITEVDWAIVGSTAGLATLLSILNSVVTGLPEAPEAPLR
jgi:hypothetical protein